MTKNTIKTQKAKHYFFLNSYEDAGFTRCPKCDNKTKLKKFPLAIHVEPNHFLVLGKTCKYCPYCDLIIVRQKEVEDYMIAIFEENDPDIIGNEYFVFGTLEYKIWRRSLNKFLSKSDAIEFLSPFKNTLHFEPRRWVFGAK
jgi:hypothetical protein